MNTITHTVNKNIQMQNIGGKSQDVKCWIELNGDEGETSRKD